MLTDDMGKITKKYETNSGHILSAALTVVTFNIRYTLPSEAGIWRLLYQHGVVPLGA